MEGKSRFFEDQVRERVQTTAASEDDHRSLPRIGRQVKGPSPRADQLLSTWTDGFLAASTTHRPAMLLPDYAALDAVSLLLTNGSGLRDRRALDSIDVAWIGSLRSPG